MGICQWKTGLLVKRQGVVGCLKGRSGMTPFATIEPRRGYELPIMFIFVAVQTEFELDLIACFLAHRDVAVSALYLGVWHYKRETCLSVINCCVCTRFPTFNIMAALASSAIGSLHKLSAMRIGMVAIRAIGKGCERFEIRTLMACQAWNSNMLSQQRELCFRVIKGTDES